MRLGPVGGLREIPSFPEVSIPFERGGSTFTSLGGTRYEQRSPRGSRSWELSLRLMSPTDLAYLTALATGAIPGPHYLYTDSAAQTNLLPADVAAPGLMGVSGLKLSGGDDPARGRVPALVAGVLTPLVGVSCDPSLNGEWTGVIPLPPGDYRLSVWATAAEEAIRWWTAEADGGMVTSGTITPSATSGGFRGQASLTVSGDAAGIRVSLPDNADPFFRVGALRLTAGTSQTTDWLSGEGVPEVVIDDPQRVLQLVTSSRIASDYTVTLREVG